MSTARVLALVKRESKERMEEAINPHAKCNCILAKRKGKGKGKAKRKPSTGGLRFE